MFTNYEQLEQKFWSLQVYFQWGLYDKTIYVELASMPHVCSIVSPTYRVTWAQTFFSQDFLLEFFFWLCFQRKKWKKKKEDKNHHKTSLQVSPITIFYNKGQLNWIDTIPLTDLRWLPQYIM